MKALLVFLIVAGFSLTAIAQTLNYKEIGEEKPRGTFTTYISKIGDTYNVGDTLQLGSPSGTNGQFVFLENMDIMGTMYDVGASAINTRTVIRKIYVKGTRRSGWKVAFQSTAPFASYYYFIEDAIEGGEIKGKGMTSDEALTELKRAKDKLDLGLITQEEYEKIREELRKYIK